MYTLPALVASSLSAYSFACHSREGGNLSNLLIRAGHQGFHLVNDR